MTNLLENGEILVVNHATLWGIKRELRQQFPDAINGHRLEAFAAGVGFLSWTSLNAALLAVVGGSMDLELDRDRLEQRLNELGARWAAEVAL